MNLRVGLCGHGVERHFDDIDRRLEQGVFHGGIVE